MKYYNLQNNFTGGEVTPLLSARSDIQKYNNSCAELLNVIPQIYGGVKKRGGLRVVQYYYQGVNTTTDLNEKQSFLMPFYLDKDNTYVVTMSSAYYSSAVFLSKEYQTNRTAYADSNGDPVGFYAGNNGIYNSGSAIGATFNKENTIRHIKSADEVYIISDNQNVNIGKKYINSQWINKSLSGFGYNAIGEYFYRPRLQGFTTLSLTIANNTTGEATNLTSNSSFFVATDVGREISDDKGGQGRLIITGFTSTTQVTCIIYSAFASATIANDNIRMSCSGFAATVTIPAHTQIGQQINITSQDFRATGEFPVANTQNFNLIPVIISANNGLFKIKSASKSAGVTTFVVDVVKIGDANTVQVQVPAYAWQFLSPIHTSSTGYTDANGKYITIDRPDSIAFYQNRLFLSGSAIKKSKIVASAIGAYSDFELGAKDSDAMDFDIAECSDRINHLIPFAGDLLAFTASGVFSIKGGLDTPITPTNINVDKISSIGAGEAVPQVIYNEIYYVDVTGTRLLSAVYDANVSSYIVNNESKLAEHITKAGIKQLAYQATPNSVLWVLMNDGSLASVTVDKTEGIVGWARHEFGKPQVDAVGIYTPEYLNDGKVDAICCVYDVVKKTDALYLTYTLAVSNNRSAKILCLMDEDCQLDLSFKASVYPNVKRDWKLPSRLYLRGQLSVIQDGIYVGEYVPSINNHETTVTLVDYPNSIEVGYKFPVKIKLLPITGSGQDGSFDHKNIKIGQVVIKCHKTLGAKFNGEFIGSARYDYSDLNKLHNYTYPTPVNAQGFITDVNFFSNQPYTTYPLFTGKYVTTKLGWNTTDDDNPRDPEEVEKITITQDLPYPLHILSVMRRVTVN